EVDENPDLYDDGHIPGAIKLHWRDDLQDPVERDLVEKDEFERLLGSLGIGNETTVVLYGDKNNWFAAYAYWYLKIYGHRDARTPGSSSMSCSASTTSRTTTAPGRNGGISSTFRSKRAKAPLRPASQFSRRSDDFPDHVETQHEGGAEAAKRVPAQVMHSRKERGSDQERPHDHGAAATARDRAQRV